MARSLRFQAFLPLKFWGECVSTTVYLLNHLPVALLQGKSPFEKLFQKPIVDLDDAEYPAASPSQYLAASPSQHSTDAVEPSSSSISTPLDLGQPILFSPNSPYISVGEPYVPSIALRKSSRTTKPPVWLADYVVPPAKFAYPISNYVAYDKLSSAYIASLAAFSAILEPKSFLETTRDPKRVEAMKAEITTLEENNTWFIIPLPSGKIPICCKWVFKVKYKSSGKVEKYKYRLVAKGWYVFQMDVHNAFLQGDLLDEKINSELIVILVYVDDLLVTRSSLRHIQQVRKDLQERFKMKDLGELKYFLGIELSRSQEGIAMCQRKYALEVVSELGLASAQPTTTPLEFNYKLTSIECDKQIPKTGPTVDRELKDKGGYPRLVGRLLYLTMTRPDIAFVVQVLSQYMHAPKVSHMEAAQRVVRYIKTAHGLGLFMSAKARKSLYGKGPKIPL
uniref:Reverse transcriptase Ty1/copia-type domain-containing protein n=1 Tax=Nicotiana tabacum TaxID=4097 RepID=A0A1S4AJL7_TOBAC|nr:PREDICTED: uncharacterized protein LOC107798417 [Nicotiana tabacum]